MNKTYCIRLRALPLSDENIIYVEWFLKRKSDKVVIFRRMHNAARNLKADTLLCIESLRQK